MGFLSYIFSIVSIAVSIYIAYNVAVRYLKIKDLPKEVIRDSEKNDYLGTLRKYAMFCVGGFGINVLAFFSPWIEFRLIIAIVAIILVCNVFSDLLDEIADFDTSKKDSDILLDYIKQTKADGKEKAKNNKIRKVDSINLSKDDIDELNK